MQNFRLDHWISWLALAVLTALLLWALDPRVGGLLLTTARFAVATTAVAVPLGTMLALAINKTNMPGRRVALGITVAMLFVPLFVVAAGWDAGFGMQGWYTMVANPRLTIEPLLTGWRAAVWIHAMAAVPWVVLIVGAGLRAVESELEEDAAMDASALVVLWRVSLRRSLAAIVVAALWVALVCAAEISITDLFQVRTFAEEIYTQSALGTLNLSPLGTPSANLEPIHLTAKGLWLGWLSLLLAAVGTLTLAQRTFGSYLVAAPTRRPWIVRLGRGRWIVAVVTWACLAMVAGVPLINLIYKAGVTVELNESGRVRSWSGWKTLRLLSTAPHEHRRELWQSARLAAAAASTAVVAGVWLAWSLRASKRTPLLRLAAMGLCLTIPGPLLGIALIRVLNQPPESPLGFIAPLYDSLFAPWLVESLRALPIATLVLWPALASVPQATLDSAMTEGAGHWRRLLVVALPQRLSAMGAAWMLSLAVAIGELAATVLVMPPGTTTISVKIFSLIHYGVDDRVAAICLILMFAVMSLTLLAAPLLRGRPQRLRDRSQ